MKIILLILAYTFSATFTFAQSKTAKQMLAEIEGQYEIDDLGYITYSKVIDVTNVTRDEMYNRAQNYFVYRYGSGKAVIQTQDKEKGTIVGHGIFPNVFTGGTLAVTRFDTWHILRVDVKEGKARIIISLTEYETSLYNVNGTTEYLGKGLVKTTFPFREKSPNKTQYSKAFTASHQKVQETFLEVQKALTTGLTGEKHEKENW